MQFVPLDRGLSISVTACLCITWIAPVALAQTVLEEIIVTATKRESSVQDIPISIEVVTGEARLKSEFPVPVNLQPDYALFVCDGNSSNMRRYSSANRP